MAFSIAYASGDAVLGYQLTVNLPTGAAGNYFQITREDVSGHYATVPVRNYDVVANSTVVSAGGGSFTAFDYEAPINKTVKYYLSYGALPDATSGGTVDSGSIAGTTFPVGFAVITDPLDPNLIVAGSVIELSEWGYESRILGSHRVLGRKNPVVATDVMSGRKGNILMSNINVFAVNFDNSGPYTAYSTFDGDWDSIFTSGDILYFRSHHTNTAFDDCYFVTESLTVSRISGVVTAVAPIRSFNIGFSEVDQPAGASAPSAFYSWATINDSNANWTEVAANHASWADVFANPTA